VDDLADAGVPAGATSWSPLISGSASVNRKLSRVLLLLLLRSSPISISMGVSAATAQHGASTAGAASAVAAGAASCAAAGTPHSTNIAAAAAGAKRFKTMMTTPVIRGDASRAAAPVKCLNRR
jgi:hypothetical protein